MAIYLDHNATTPLDERVLEAMLPWMRGGVGNPSSTHSFGRTARAALEGAREQVAALVGAHPSQVIFTSGGTESNNMALKGVGARLGPGRVAISAVEHASVSAPAAFLRQAGWHVDTLPVDAEGRVAPAAVTQALRHGARLVSVMAANNETGVLQDIPAIAGLARETGALLHTDAVQAVGKIPVDFAASGAHLMSLSAHKFNGPKGVGALVVDKAVDMEPLLHGGGQEKGRRAGTENLAGIAGLGVAAELAAAELDLRRRSLTLLRERLERGLRTAVPEAVVFAGRADRLPNTVFLAVQGLDGETLLMGLDREGIAVSSGAACGSGVTEPSHVLKAMGVPPELARGAIRVSLGLGNSERDVDGFLEVLRRQVKQLKAMVDSAWG